MPSIVCFFDSFSFLKFIVDETTNYEVPGELFVSASGSGCLYRFALVHSTPGSNAISPYLNFDPKILNSVRDANERRMESEEEQHV